MFLEQNTGRRHCTDTPVHLARPCYAFLDNRRQQPGAIIPLVNISRSCCTASTTCQSLTKLVPETATFGADAIPWLPSLAPPQHAPTGVLYAAQPASNSRLTPLTFLISAPKNAFAVPGLIIKSFTNPPPFLVHLTSPPDAAVLSLMASIIPEIYASPMSSCL